MLPFNILPVFVAAAAAFIIGFLLHGPVARKLWIKLANIHPTGNEKLKDMIPQMIWNFIVNVVTAFVMAGAFWIAFSSPLIGDGTWYLGAMFGVCLWAGFLLTSSAIEVIWMGRNYKLWLFEAGCSLITTATMGAILAGW
jgi:hypothetical protein